MLTLLFSLLCYGALALIALLATGFVVMLVAHRVMQQANGLLMELATIRTMWRGLFPQPPKPVPPAVHVKTQHWLDQP